MARVRMIIHTGYNGKKVSPGDVLDINSFLAERWESEGYAEMLPDIVPESKPARKQAEKKKVD